LEKTIAPLYIESLNRVDERHPKPSLNRYAPAKTHKTKQPNKTLTKFTSVYTERVALCLGASLTCYLGSSQVLILVLTLRNTEISSIDIQLGSMDIHRLMEQ